MAELFQITEYGRLRANPNGNTDHRFVRMSDCPEAATAMDELIDTVPNTESVVSMSWEGQTVTFDTPILVTNVDALKAAIENHLLTNTTAQEYDVRVEVSYGGGDLTVRHYGATTIASLTTDGPATYNFTRKSTLKSYCLLTAYLVGSVPNITINGTDVALATGTYAYTGTPATDASTAGDLETDIDTALTSESVDYTAVTVEVNDETSSYKVTVRAVRGTVLSAGAKRFIEGECEVVFA